MLIVLVSGLLLLFGVIIGIVIGTHIAGRGTMVVNRESQRQPQGVTVNVIGSASVQLPDGSQNPAYGLEAAGRPELHASPRRIVSEPYSDPYRLASAEPYSLPARPESRSPIVPSRVIREIGREES